MNISFFFVFSECYLCHYAALRFGRVFHVLYWAILASLFNIGWASVQVMKVDNRSLIVQVSHMSLVPELTQDESERVQLNSARYASGIVATLMVLGISLVAFQQFHVSQYAFHIIAICCLGKTFHLLYIHYLSCW